MRDVTEFDTTPLMFRTAQLDDADFLLSLRNDPTTRRFSFTQNHISRDEHIAWFTERLSDPATLIWIALYDERPAGQLRLTQTDGLTAEVHIAVAPEFRGLGLAREMLTGVVDLCEAAWPQVTRIGARIMPENEASLKAFRAAGFRDVEDSDEHGSEVLERRLCGGSMPPERRRA